MKYIMASLLLSSAVGCATAPGDSKPLPELRTLTSTDPCFTLVDQSEKEIQIKKRKDPLHVAETCQDSED